MFMALRLGILGTIGEIGKIGRNGTNGTNGTNGINRKFHIKHSVTHLPLPQILSKQFVVRRVADVVLT